MVANFILNRCALLQEEVIESDSMTVADRQKVLNSVVRIGTACVPQLLMHSCPQGNLHHCQK